MRRLTPREERFQKEIQTALACLDTAHGVLSRVVADKPPKRSSLLTLHLWVWASTVSHVLTVLRDQLRAAAESTPEKLERERGKPSRRLLSPPS